MPQTAVASVEIDRVLPLEDIGPALSQICADQRMPA
jgi:hypothetical protein